MKLFLILLTAFLLCSEIVFAAPFAYVANNDSNDVSVIDVSTKKKIATIDVGNTPSVAAVSVDGKYVYVANSGSNSVSVIEVSTNKVVDTVDVNDDPLGIAVSPDGDFVYVANNGSDNVSIIDTSSNSVVGTVSIGARPEGIAFSPDSKYAYVAATGNNVVNVIEVSSMTFVKTLNNAGDEPTCITIDPDGKFAYVTNINSQSVVLIDLSTDQVSDSISLESAPDGGQGSCLQLTPDGTTLYVAYATQIGVIDVATKTVLKWINTNGNGWAVCLAITPDGESVYVSNIDPSGNTPNPPISIIDVSNNTVVDETIVAGDDPYGIAMTPESTTEAPEPQHGNSGNDSCSLAQSGSTNSSLPFSILILMSVVALRMTRRRNNS